MLSGCGDHGPDVGEDPGSLDRAETPRDLHTHFHHAQVLFGLIVGEGDVKIRKEPQDVAAEVSQANEEIMPRPSRLSPSRTGFWHQWWQPFMEVCALGKDCHVLGEYILMNGCREFGVASPLRGTLQLIGVGEQRAQLCRPWLFFDLGDGPRFAQVMCPTEGVCVHPLHMGVIRFPVIMDDRPTVQEGWNSTAPGIDPVVGECAITDRMQPVQLAGDTQPGLVQMPNTASREGITNVLDHATQTLRCATDPVGHAGRAQAGGSEQIPQELADPIFGDQLLDIAVDRRGPYARTILHMRAHALGKRGRCRGSAMRAAVIPRVIQSDRLSPSCGLRWM